jgi:hypothetical protein
MSPSSRPGQASPARGEGIIVAASRFVLVVKQSLILDKFDFPAKLHSTVIGDFSSGVGCTSLFLSSYLLLIYDTVRLAL